jgi:hypothetical protein
MLQWPWVLAKGYEGDPHTYAPTNTYSINVQTDSTYGHCCRFELRDGDIPPGGGGQRAEFASLSDTTTATGGGEGSEFWYEMAFNFDATFPSNHPALGFGLVEQWKTPGNSSPAVGWYVDQVDDHFSMVIQKQSSPAVYLSIYSILNLPLNRGNWNHLTVHMVISTSDTVGLLEVWLNGARQTFLDGSKTYHVRTMVPNSANELVGVKEGYYRDHTITVTGILKHAGFRCCTAPSGLSRPIFG